MEIWEEYLVSGILQRRKLVKTLPLVKQFANFDLHKLSQNQRENIVTTALVSYFENLLKTYKQR